MRMLLLLTALLPVTAYAALPENIWEDKYGTPSITANQQGVSVVIPEGAIAASGAGSLAAITKDFLERWAPGMCSDVLGQNFFQQPHKGLHVEVALESETATDPNNDDQPVRGGHLFLTGHYGIIVLDYTPSRKVVCVTPSDLVS